MIYLSAADLIYVHHAITRLEGIRSLDLLESAAELPKQTFGGEELYPTVTLKAAVLLRSIVKNHPFVDGNKRVAFAAMHAFLGFNGYRLTMDQDQAYEFVIWVAESHVEVAEIEERLLPFVAEI